MLCDYGCGQEATYQFKNGKWCCSKFYRQCPNIKKGLSKKFLGNKNPMYGKKPWNKNKTNIYSKETLDKLKKPKNENHKIKISITKSFSIKSWKKRYPTFAKVEEMRYNPDKPDEKEIQVHCKNHKCKNSKEQGGWFIPTKIQFFERIRQIEQINGNGGSYFYCCDQCKKECPLFKVKGDPYKFKIKLYTEVEYQTFRKVVLEREHEICEYCGEPANTVHHIMTQKLEPWHVLDPDYGVACCTKCHYKFGHKDECSTGNLSNKECV